MAAEAAIVSDFGEMQAQVYIACLIQESADFEFAFQMQLDEALRVSGVSGAERSSSAAAGDVDGKRNELADHIESVVEQRPASITKQNILEYRGVSLTMQKEEMQKMQQEMEDAVVAFKEQERFRQLDAVTQHDALFAAFLSTLSPNEWSESGDELSDPFTFPSVAERAFADISDDAWEPPLAAEYFMEPGSTRDRSTVTTDGGRDDEHDWKTALRPNFRNLRGDCFRGGQEIEDAVVAFKEQERFRQLEAVAQDDAHFAAFLSTLSPNELSGSVDELSDPFTFPSVAERAFAEEGQRHARGSRSLKSGLMLDGASTSGSSRGDAWEPALAAEYFLEPGSTRDRSTVTTDGGRDEEHDWKTASRLKFRDMRGDCTSVCSICVDTVMSPDNSTVVSDECKHDFCKECLRMHAETEVKSGKCYITCPALACKVRLSTKLSSEMLSSSSQSLLERRQIEKRSPQPSACTAHIGTAPPCS